MLVKDLVFAGDVVCDEYVSHLQGFLRLSNACSGGFLPKGIHCWLIFF